MAVENKWVDTSVAAGKKGNPAKVMPGQIFGFACTFEVAAADDDGSIYKLANVGSNMIPLWVKVNNDAITGSTDWDLGFYTEAGVVVDKDILANTLDLSSAHVFGSELDAMENLGVEKAGQKVWEILGKTVNNKDNAYVLALTANTVGSAAGTVTVRGLFIQG